MVDTCKCVSFILCGLVDMFLDLWVCEHVPTYLRLVVTCGYGWHVLVCLSFILCGLVGMWVGWCFHVFMVDTCKFV